MLVLAVTRLSLSLSLFLTFSAPSGTHMNSSTQMHTQLQPLHTQAVYLEIQGHKMTTAGSPWLKPKKGLTFPSGSKLER